MWTYYLPRHQIIKMIDGDCPQKNDDTAKYFDRKHFIAQAKIAGNDDNFDSLYIIL